MKVEVLSSAYYTGLSGNFKTKWYNCSKERWKEMMKDYPYTKGIIANLAAHYWDIVLVNDRLYVCHPTSRDDRILDDGRRQKMSPEERIAIYGTSELKRDLMPGGLTKEDYT